MKKAIAFLFLLLLIVLFAGVVLFFRGAPELTPEPLKPVLSWVDDKQLVVSKHFAHWQRQLLGEQAPAVASDSVSSAEPLAQVTLGRNEVSTVTVDQNGQVAVKPPAIAMTTPEAADQPADDTQSAGTQVADTQVADTQVADTQTADTTEASAAAESGAESSAELDAIARADAAIAAADAALARAQGKPVPAGALAPRPINVESAPAGETVTSDAAPARATAATAQTNTEIQPSVPAPSGGSALGGATVALSQTGQPLLAGETTVLAAIPAPTIIPPDSPAPMPAVSEAGREQQAIIENFLAGEVVEFETGRDVLTPKGRRALQALLGIIGQNQNSVITIQGHTDSVGDERSNLELSTARAIAARSYLIRRGVEAERLLVQGFGERKPISTNRTAEGRERNRRIDFAVSDR